MQERVTGHEAVSEARDSIDRDDLLKTVASLRNDVSCMTTDIREVLTENAELKRQVEQLRERNTEKRSYSEVLRIKDDVDRLMNLYETASTGRATARQAPRPEPKTESNRSEPGSMMKKMMMFMMMSELI